MTNFSLVFPVLPGKTKADIMQISDAFNHDPASYRESNRQSGLTLQRAYLQETPMGSFVVAYMEGDKSFEEMMGAVVSSNLTIDKEFVRLVEEIHGIDLTQPPAGPSPEVVGSWSDPNVTGRRPGLAFSAPLLPGKTEEGRVFAQEAFQTRSEQFAASRRAKGVSLEIVTLQSTPMGDVVNVYTEGVDPHAANKAFAESKNDYDVWFKDQLVKLFPDFIDFGQPIPGLSEIFDSEKLG